jgi:uncharacterized membrane protein YdjX (TVP38/TMEM64 family)
MLVAASRTAGCPLLAPHRYNQAMMKILARPSPRLLLAVLLGALVGTLFVVDAGQYFRLEYFTSRQAAVVEFARASPLLAGSVAFAIYVAYTGLGVPGAAILALAVGAVFGLLWGAVIASFAASLGSTLAFLSSRFLFREAVRKRFGHRLRAVDAGFEREGVLYLLALRIAPVLPYVLVNLVMGLTPVKARTFYAVSQLGMLPATILYVNAGTQLATIRSVAGILSPELIGSLALLGTFPLVAKHVLESIKARRRLASR